MVEDDKKGIDFGNVAVVSFLGMIVLGIIGTFTSSMIILCLLIVDTIIFICGIIGMTIQNKAQEKRYLDKLIDNMDKFQLEYDNYIDKMGIVKSDIQATLIEMCEYDFEAEIPQYLWIENNNLNMFPKAEYYKNNETSAMRKPDVSKLQLKTIPIESILYFEKIGELRKYTKVSGGGSSLKGALAGYAIAGDVGAIIGSRESIKTEVVSEDDRRVELIYKNLKNEVVNLEFEHDAYNVLKKVLPSKELRKIVNLQSVQTHEDRLNKDHSPSAKEKLMQLSELKKEGLITEEDFLEQKKKILDLL